MTMILAKLNLRSLKQVRLVCKSWLREAGPHIENRVRAVRLNRELSSATRFPQFLDLLAKKFPGLPQPFNSIDMDLAGDCHTVLFNAELPKQLLSLCPPLVLTRFTPWDMPLELALPLIIQCSSSLEYLHLRDHDSSKADYSPLMDPKQQFLKLISLKVSAAPSYYPSRAYNRIRFPPIIAWIVKASPNLEKCVFLSGVGEELTTRLLKEVNIQNVKELQIENFHTSPHVLELYLSIPFRQLEHLNLQGCNYFQVFRMSAQIVNHSANTLRKLGLLGFQFPENPRAAFPICPNVQELSIGTLVYSSDFLLQHFPSLKELNVGELNVKVDDDEGWSWSTLSPFLGVKTLRICGSIMTWRFSAFSTELTISEEIRFLEKFPQLERLNVHPSWLRHCCELKVSHSLEFTKLLAEVKHLVVPCLDRYYTASTSERVGGSGSWLAVLPGIETISMNVFNFALVSAAAKDLPNLRIMAFPWGYFDRLTFDPDMKALLEVIRGVEKVLITNCCSSPSSPRLHSHISEMLLQQFYELAPNAHCGCGSRGMPLK